LFDVRFAVLKRLVDRVQALPNVRTHRRKGEGFDLSHIPQALRRVVGHGAAPPVQNPLVPPFEQAGCRAQRVGGKTPVVETLVVVELLQAVPVLDDAFGLRGM